MINLLGQPRDARGLTPGMVVQSKVSGGRWQLVEEVAWDAACEFCGRTDGAHFICGDGNEWCFEERYQAGQLECIGYAMDYAPGPRPEVQRRPVPEPDTEEIRRQNGEYLVRTWGPPRLRAPDGMDAQNRIERFLLLQKYGSMDRLRALSDLDYARVDLIHALRSRPIFDLLNNDEGQLGVIASSAQQIHVGDELLPPRRPSR